MKRFLRMVMLSVFVVSLGCSVNTEQEILSSGVSEQIDISAPVTPHVTTEDIPTPVPTELPATEPSVETDVISVPVSELIVHSPEEIPDLTEIAGMESLKLLDLTELPNTDIAYIEQIRTILPECRIVWNQMLTDGAFRSDSSSLTLPHATAEDLAILHVFSNLRYVDATGSTAYAALLAFRDANPQIALHYAYRCGDMTVTESDTSITVPAGSDASELISVLHAFPSIHDIDLCGSEWGEEEIAAIVSAFPEKHIHRIVRFEGISADSETELLDLRSLSGWNVEQICDRLSAFPSLKTLALPEEFNTEDEMKIAAAFPHIRIIGPVSCFGRTFDGGAEEIDLSGITIASTDEAEELLQELPFLKKAIMCECGMTDAQMEALCSTHPEIRFVWTIVIGKRKLRTDAIGFSTKNPSKYTNPNSSDAYNQSVRKAVRLYEGDIEALKYCTDLEALDLGHNYLTNNDLKVISGLTKLKILILADNKITDISALTTLKDLEYIELFMNRIPDLSPLTEMPSLVDVNVCNVGAEDLTPLFSLTWVKRLWYAMNPFSREQAKELKEALSDCLCNYTTRNETAEGWRDDPRYQWMRSYFN